MIQRRPARPGLAGKPVACRIGGLRRRVQPKDRKNHMRLFPLSASLAGVVVLIACGQSSNPVSPSPARSSQVALTGSFGVLASPAATQVDDETLARCFAGAADAACFTGAA